MIFFFSFIISVALIKIILVTAPYHHFITYEYDTTQVHKFHTEPTPRVGGIALFGSLLAGLIYSYINGTFIAEGRALILSVSIIFFIGLAEDIYKNLPASSRLLFLAIGVLIGCYIFHSIPIISNLGLEWFNYLLKLPKIGYIFGLFITLICVIGLTNAYNIIDGYHGLCAITALVNLAGLTFIAYIVHDYDALFIISILSASILGFIIFNYPYGKIFLGDGGAYLVGFIIVVISINLTQKYNISPFVVILMAIYPITEVVFSIYRKKFLRKTPATKPDGLHLHMLIYKRCTIAGSNNRNAKVMPVMLYFILPPSALSVIFYQNSYICIIFIILFVIFYIICYFKIIKFKTFSFLKYKHKDFI